MADLDPISTAPFYDQVRLRSLWPTGPQALCKLTVALLPLSALPYDHPLRGLLAEEDWFLDGGGPCLVLGEGQLGPSGQYYPRASYPVEEALRLTRQFRVPQRELEEKARKRAERERGIAAVRQERADKWVEAVKAQQAAEQHKADLRAATTPLAQAKLLLELQGQLAAAAKELAALTARLGRLEEELGVAARSP